VVKISKIQSTTTVSPSSTAARMGVVQVSAPNIADITNSIANSLNTFGEAQAKLYDANWLNDYEFNTGQFINNKVDTVLASGEMPNLEEFTTEMSAYNNGILSEAPERLKIAAEGYYNQKFIAGFNILKDQANNLTFKESELKFNTWSNNILTDAEHEFLNITRTAANPEDALAGVHEYSATVLTSALATHSEKYRSLFPFSNGTYNESTLKVSELELLSNIEVARNNAILRSFYQNIDITNATEVAIADGLANEYIDNYVKNKNNARGINYDVFTDETGIKTGEGLVQEIINKSEQYLGQLRSVNTKKTIKAEGYNKLQAKKQYNDNYDNLTNYSYWGSNSIYVKGNLNQAPGTPQGYTSWTLEDFEKTYADIYSDTEILNLFNANQEKLFVMEYYDEAIRNTENGENSFRSLSSSSQFNQMITASESELMQGYFQYRFGDDYIDSPQYYDNLTPDILTQINDVYRKEMYVPEGMQQWFNTVNMANIEDMDVRDVNDILINRIGTYKNLTSNADNKFNIDTEIATMYDEVIRLQNKGFQIPQIRDHLIKKSKYSEQDLNSINDSNQTFLTSLIENPDTNFEKFFIDHYVQTQKNRRKSAEQIVFGDDGITQYRGGMDVGATDTESGLIEELTAEAIVIYNKSSNLIDTIFMDNTLEFMNLMSNKGMSNDDQEIVFKKSIKYALNGTKKAGYGTTKFGDNIPGDSYVYLPIEQQHKNLSEKNIGDTLTSYVYNNIQAILSDENNELYNEVANQFRFGENIEQPTHEEIQNLIEQGNIYVTPVLNGLNGKDTMYEVHIANSGSKFDEPYGYDTLNHLTFDGSYFNPTIYTGGGILTKEFIQEIINGNIVVSDDGKIDFGQLGTRLIIPNIAINTSMFDAIEQQYYGPLKRALTIGGDNVDKIYSQVLQDIYTGQTVDFQDIGTDTKVFK